MGIREAIKERRFYSLRIPPDDIIRIFQQAKDDKIYLPHFKDLPEGTVAMAVTFDMEMDCFCIKIVHPSFDSVPFGARIPIMAMDVGIYEIKKEI